MAGQNLGPLTAGATLPSTCTSEFETIYKIVTAPGYYLLNGPLDVESCYPSNYAGVSSQYYSPAAACPFGFTSACSHQNTAGSVTETVYTCCPTQSSYHCQSDTAFPWDSTMACANTVDFSVSTTWTVVQVDGDATSTVTSAGLAGGMNAFGIEIRFQASDLITTTSSQTSGPSATTASTISTATPSISTETSTADKAGTTSSGLSAGAAAGIGVAAAVVAIGIIGAAAFVMWKRRKQRRSNKPSLHGAAGAPSPASWNDAMKPSIVPQDSGSNLYELSNDAPPQIYEAPNSEYEPYKYLR